MVIDPDFFVALFAALAAVGFNPAAPIWRDLLQEAACRVDHALVEVGPASLLPTKGFDLYQPVNLDLRRKRLEPFFTDLLRSVSSYDAAAAASAVPASAPVPPPAPSGMTSRSSAPAPAPALAPISVVNVQFPPLAASAYSLDDFNNPGAHATFAVLIGPTGTLSRLGYVSEFAGSRFPAAARSLLGNRGFFLAALQACFSSSATFTHLSSASAAPPLGLTSSRLGCSTASTLSSSTPAWPASCPAMG